MQNTELTEQQAVMEWAEYQTGRYPELKLLYHIPNEGKRSVVNGANLKKASTLFNASFAVSTVSVIALIASVASLIFSFSIKNSSVLTICVAEDGTSSTRIKNVAVDNTDCPSRREISAFT